jgi:hypothetical protein
MDATAESAARAIELTDNLIDRAYEIARESSNDRAIKRLDDASRIQQNARNAHSAGQFNRAVEFTRRARDVARKSMGSANRDVDAGSAKRALERTDETIAKLRESLDNDTGDTASQLYERAVRRQNEAWNAFDAGDFRKALANTKVARNLANRALRHLKNG